jgi:hypothetical protein
VRNPFDKDHFIHGDYSLNAGKLVYRTLGPQHMYAVVSAMRTKREFKVTALTPESTGFTGLVISADRVAGSMPPTWEIVMVVGASRR